jgi:hypothetical protein
MHRALVAHLNHQDVGRGDGPGDQEAVRAFATASGSRGGVITVAGKDGEHVEVSIKDRLRALQPNAPDSYHATREIVPNDMLDEVNRAKEAIASAVEAEFLLRAGLGPHVEWECGHVTQVSALRRSNHARIEDSRPRRPGKRAGGAGLSVVHGNWIFLTAP